MLVAFDTLSPESRVWIYQSNRNFTEVEQHEISEKLTEFVEQWMAHGQPLKASFVLPHNRFIVIAADQAFNTPTGCSIDAQVKLILELEQTYGLQLLDKMNVTFKTGEYFAYKPLLDFKKMIKDKSVNEETIVFNNLVNSIAEWHDSWQVPIKDSWHSRFL